VRAISAPARQLAAPPAATERPDVERLPRVTAEFGIEILGPPGIPA
jgi:hypothetical protein